MTVPAARVLVIEDDGDIATLLSRHVARTGHYAVVASTACAALDSARATRPDLVLLDIGLPDMDGWTLLDRLRNDVGLTDVPVLVVSVIDQEEPIGRRIDGYVTKPFRSRDIDAQITRLLPHRPDPEEDRP